MDAKADNNAPQEAGLVHVVVLKAKSDTKAADIQSLIDESYSELTKIKTVRALWAGRRAEDATPDAMTDYTVSLVLLFDDAAGLKSYLNDPVHTRFTDKHLKNWEFPVVYDFEPRRPKS
jgi:Stress responsive A/B Barrel Domain